MNDISGDYDFQDNLGLTNTAPPTLDLNFLETVPARHGRSLGGTPAISGNLDNVPLADAHYDDSTKQIWFTMQKAGVGEPRFLTDFYSGLVTFDRKT
jgi:hypothetical protein